MINPTKEFETQIQELMAFLSRELQLIAEKHKKPGLDSDINSVFKSFVIKTRQLSLLSQQMTDIIDSQQRTTERLREQNRRLELLYTTGLSFQSEAEIQSILETAIDVLIKELESTTGYIIFLNDSGIIDTVVSRNMNEEQEQKAFEISTSVFRKAIDQLITVNYAGDIQELIQQESIINLKVSAALCIPMISGERVLGALYLDKRESDGYFDESDVTFLNTFAKQLVVALDSLKSLLNLQENVTNNFNDKFRLLRGEIDCKKIIGSGKSIYDVLDSVQRVSKTEVPVFISGENGTGKELIAECIHKNSNRSAGPFIAINCAAIPAELLESELFGYEQGAFSGAVKSKPGKLELANNGTFFFDEIGDMSPNLQAKILRVLQNKTVERLGSNQQRELNVRFIAATNQDLIGLVKTKQFREDLYYRIRVMEIKLPALRERIEDIKELAEYFLNKYSENGVTYHLDAEVITQLQHYEWPGNVRELENVIQRALVLAKDETITIDLLPPEIISREALPTENCEKVLAEAEYEFRRKYVLRVLQQYQSKSKAAKVLGVNRTHFYRLLQQLDISYERE